MIATYRELFAAPGTRAFTLAGILARLPLPMTGIGIIVMLSQSGGSYALAGAVSATFVLTYALISPQISRLADRYGQRRVLPAATAVSSLGFLTLSVNSLWQDTAWLMFAGAMLTGFMPAVSAMIRTRWTALYRGRPLLQTAYSLETVLDELSFIAGPPLAVALGVIVQPQAALLVAMLLLIVGIAALLAQRVTEPPQISRDINGGSQALIHLPTVRLLVILMMAMGVIVGTIDIVSVAFATKQGQPALASLVLSAYALGSCFAGLLFGTLKLRATLNQQLVFGGLGTALATLPLIMAGSILSLTAAVLLSGLFFAPTMIVAMSLVERTVPEHRVTEGMAWLLAGLNIGVALGAAVAGQVLNHGSPSQGFSVAAGAAAVILAVVFYGFRRPEPAVTGE
ncbi:MFS transporter [Erwinia sp. S43]|uniref:MFS transporter n=1 Tax=Erwinia sp. S43 TaxID=2769339 RepID=UPI00190D80B0|nr:MFS transporter [Erwinia sp. S43]MBK0031120.1 MFS transporter [Erwinia sp. S43]